ncbi:MAG: chemotaxis protein CheB [Methylacidiphilales bacterium]|nr:chemotaxis protein CheB [Candidatus Methylacidiphilales bacterium]NJR14782.1 chemotaxis protein CheB [Calothrix sp. CSU_2_0]
MTFKLIVLGTSLGGFSALKKVLKSIPEDIGVPIAIAQHRHPDSSDTTLRDFLQQETALSVREVEDKDKIQPGYAYLTPADYHLLVEAGHFALSVDEPVCYARPSIDVLFESAADVYREQVIGVILTGANADGSQGLKTIQARGGVTIVQEPSTAECGVMPQAAINAVARVDWILPLERIAAVLAILCDSIGK